MNRYFTIMIIPDQGKGVRSFRIPKMLFRTLVLVSIILMFVLLILTYDYRGILKQMYENRHLSTENTQLKKQIQIFNMKIDSLAKDIERIQNFEKKLRIISGIEQIDMTKPLIQQESDEDAPSERIPTSKIDTKNIQDSNNFKDRPEFIQLKKLYEQKITEAFNLNIGHPYTREWNELMNKSFLLAARYAEFDYKYQILKNHVGSLEINVHKLDQYLLDKNSFLSSTPTLLPVKGWVTSYYGPRISPISNRLKMHEGIDIGARPGTPILAPADGVVTYAGHKPGFGKFIQLDHGHGVETIYAHAKTLTVDSGRIVTRGEQLATIGSTGYSTGPHVHYEVRINGTPVDPLFFILEQIH